MAQFQWTVPSLSGRQYNVGLYHGEDSGHLTVYCNNKVLLIDFNVQESKSYSFYLDTELFDLNLVLEQGQFTYDLSHNEEIDSPYNRRRKSDEKTNRWRKIASLVLIGFFAIILLARYVQSPTDELSTWDKLLVGEGVATQVSLFQKQDEWYVSYRVDNAVQEVSLMSTEATTTLGFPLSVGDQFGARYAADRPRHILIEWNRPTAPVLERYRELTIKRHAELHPNLSPAQVRCQIDLAIELEGIAGLSKCYQQEETDGPIYDTNAYLRLVRSTAFRQGVMDCL